MSDTLYAGAARRIANPPLGIRTAGFSSREGLVQAIESDLTVTALVLSNGAAKVALIAIDIGLVPMDVMTDLRRRVGEAIGAPASHVMINQSHTHSAPNLPGWLGDTPEQTALQTRYQADLVRWTIEAAAEANANLREARIAAGWGECHISINRREMGPDGKVFLGENPDGPTDPAVGVVRVDDLNGNPIAILFSYGCHTVVVGPRSLVSSPDFPGAARDLVERTLGGLSLFLQACGGDIMPAGGMGYEVDCRDAKNRLGMMLGAEVIKVAAGLRTHIRRGPRTSLSSVSRITLWPWIPVDGPTCSYLGAVDDVLPLPFIQLPSLTEAEALRDKWAKAFAEAEARRARDAEINIARRFADWGEKLVDAVHTSRRAVDMPIQAIRVNDIVLAGMAAEVFSTTGLTLKGKAPFAHTQVLGYTNGLAAYLPLAGDYPPGGWDVHERYGVPDMIFQAYSLPVAISPESEQLAVNRMLALWQTLV